MDGEVFGSLIRIREVGLRVGGEGCRSEWEENEGSVGMVMEVSVQ